MAKPVGQLGAGLLSTLFGTFVFLVFLMFGAQEALRAYESTTVSALTFDAARSVANSPDDQPLSESTNAAEIKLRARLGDLGTSAEVSWILDDPDSIGLTVAVPAPRSTPLISITPSSVVGTARVRRERVQP